MRQVYISRYGPPDVLEDRETSDPLPGPGEVRIRVRAAGVSFADILARLGLYPDALRLPLVAGYEVAGYVDLVGAEVLTIAPGDHVLALTPFGGYSDLVVVDAAGVFPVPGRLSDAEAAAIPMNYLTAAIALYKLANLGAGETVLIHGAAGGVGVAATQLARARRATIIGTASAMKHDALRTFGVDHPIDSQQRAVAAEVMRITRNRGVDVVLDSIGGDSFRTSYHLLAPLGRLVIYGVSGVAAGGRATWLRKARAVWRMPRFRPLALMNRNRSVLGLHMGRLWGERRTLAPMMQTLLSEFQAARLRPVVAKTFPLDRAAEAHRYVQSRSNIGKVVLTT
jgi:NADPH:quinone reductase-like Zn-dependent oxidoreductase